MDNSKVPKIRDGIKAPPATIEATETSKKIKRKKVGRPQKSPNEEVLKNKTFNLPLSLTNRIVEYAEENYDGNASAFAKEVFQKYLDKAKNK